MEEINAKERKEKEDEEETGMEVIWSMENQSKSVRKVTETVSGDEDGSEADGDVSFDDDEDEDIKNNPSDDAGDADDDGFNDPFFTEPTETAEKSAGDGTTSTTKKKKKKTKKKKEPLTEEEQKQKVFNHFYCFYEFSEILTKSLPFNFTQILVFHLQMQLKV